MSLTLTMIVAFSTLFVLNSAMAQSDSADDFNKAALELVQQRCVVCHTLDQVSRSSGYSREDWRELTETMVDFSNPAEGDLIATYLAAHYPEHKKRSPALIAGATSISFREWRVPTSGQRARDPIQAPDGSIWWAGQWGNLIGQIDPKTNNMKEYSLPANAMPHTVTHDQDGNIWYTGNKNGSVGKFNVSTEAITVYKMPDAAAKDPHSAIFDKKGMLWFTLQQSNKVGRLDPATGEITLKNMPTPNARPYGIKLDSDNNPWVACNGSNCLVKIEAETFTLHEYKLPDVRTRVRRLDFSSDGMLWYVNSSLGRLGRFDPKTGVVKEWPSPSGPSSHPYAIAVIDDVIWYNESGMRPDALVRFDPKAESFQSWPIASGGVYAGIVRHMRATREGELLIHQSSTNRIILVSPSSPSSRVGQR